MRAERDRRAAILTAEGEKQAQILTAEGAQQAAVLTAEGERQAAILRAEGEAKAIDTVFKAIHEGRPTRELLSYEYLQMLPSLAEGDSNKVFVIPSEFAEAFGGIGEALTRRAGERAAGELATEGATGELPAGGGEPPAGAPAAGILPASAEGRAAGIVFDSLAEKLQATLAEVRQRGTLTEQDIDHAMREIRLALLEADVNFKVVKQFTANVKERCLGAEIVGRLNPGQQVIKIVAEELTALMGGEVEGLRFASSPPTVILLAGLQGSGKTTAAAKLAHHLREEHGSAVALAACDTYRPAAVEQLVKMGTRAGAVVYERGTEPRPRGDRGVGAAARARGRQGRADRRHQRPAARR